MITESDLLAAIAECEGERSPNANTCMKLSAYYILLREKQGQNVLERQSYSYAPAVNEVKETVDYYSETEFAQVINGKSADDVWAIMDELATTIQAIQPRLYAGLIRKLREI